MNELDISNYLTPRYLAELLDDKIELIDGERYDWDLSMALETIYLEIGLRQCGLPPEIILISRMEIISYFIIMEIISYLTILFNAYLITCIKWGKEYIVYSEVLLVSTLLYYNFSVEIMN